MIPKKMHLIRVGPLQPPMQWIQTRIDHHKDWDFKIRWNEELENHDRICKNAINHYKRKRKRNGVADCMRYQILYEEWWFVIGADWECINPIDDLLDKEVKAYQIDTSRQFGSKNNNARLASMPLFASIPWYDWAMQLLDMINSITDYSTPAATTWNRLMQKRNQRGRWTDCVRLPMRQFIPVHYDGIRYDWNDKIYSLHHWGTTRWNYIINKDKLKWTKN